MVAKLTLLLICLAVGTASAAQTITLKVKNEKLDNVLREIKRQTGYDYVYNARFASAAKTITIDVHGKDLTTVLNECLQDQPFTYEITDKIIVIKEKPPIKQADPKNAEAAPLVQTPPPPVTVKGKVINENGEPIPGVTITIKGTTTRTSTNDAGEFTITAPDANSMLVISAITIIPFETTISGNTQLNLVAKIKISELQEVMVNKGYYTTTQKMNTGNVSIVKSEEIQRRIISNPLDALSGNVPGLLITQTAGGRPGTTYTIRLQGQNSIANGNDPLFVIDGVPFVPSAPVSNMAAAISPLNTINASDIESIDVLKDADATAIYGTRGANGVILITTKKGKAGNTRVDADVYAGWGKNTRSASFLNTQQYLAMRKEAFANDGVITYPTTAYDINGAWDTTRYTDWQKVLIGGTAKYFDAQVSVSGGNAGTQFRIASGVHKETTVYPGDFGTQRSSFSANMSHVSANQKFTASLSAFFVEYFNNLPRDLRSFINLPPDAPPLYSVNGSLNWQNSTWTNPFSFLQIATKSTTDNLNANLSLGYDILPGLKIKANLGYNYVSGSDIQTTPLSSFNPANAGATASAIYSNLSTRSLNIEPQLTYSKGFHKNQLDIVAGTTFLDQETNSVRQTGTGYTSDALIGNIGAASAVSSGLTYYDYRYASVFGRLGYSYDSKYLINITARRDASSRFGPGKQFGNFGAVGIGWIFSNESFMQNSMISFAKIRASFGTTGNDQIGDYQYLDSYSSSGSTYLGLATLRPSRLANPDYSWEVNNKFEAGLDLSFLQDKIRLSVSYYLNRSSNQLLAYVLPLTSGFVSGFIENLPAVVTNSGLQFSVNSVNLKSKDFRWSTSFNITLPKTILSSYPDIASSNYANLYVVGQSLFISKKYQYTGVDQQTGLYTFNDLNKDGKISTPNDQVIVNIDKQYFGGLQNRLQYKQFQLDFILQFVGQSNGLNYNSGSTMPGTMNNQLDYVLNRWQKPGDNTSIQKFSNSSSATSYSLMSASNFTFSDASFIRLKNISLSYQFPQRFMNKAHLQSARLYVHCQNLFTITRYLGLDPETTSQMPPLRIVATGIQISL